MKIFLAYAPEDSALKQELTEHLSLLQRQGYISVWHDLCILPGEDHNEKISEYINNADLILLLISSDFLASDHAFHTEMKTALKRQKEGTARVIPVILRDCVWRIGELASLSPLPNNGHAISSARYWESRDAAFKEVVLSIQKIIGAMGGEAIKYPSGQVDFQDSGVGAIPPKSNWRRFVEQFSPLRALLGGILLSILSGLGYWFWTQKTDILEQPRLRQQLEGTWIHANYADPTLVISKLVFKDDEVRVYSKNDRRELYWGSQKLKTNDGKIEVEYEDWGIRFLVEPDIDSKTQIIHSLVTIYRQNAGMPEGINIVNDTLIRPMLAFPTTSSSVANGDSAHSNGNGNGNNDPSTPAIIGGKFGDNNTLQKMLDTVNLIYWADSVAKYCKDTAASDNPKDTSLLSYRKYLDQSYLCRSLPPSVAHSIEANDSMPVETLYTSPFKKLNWRTYQNPDLFLPRLQTTTPAIKMDSTMPKKPKSIKAKPAGHPKLPQNTTFPTKKTDPTKVKKTIDP